jgi:RimJ/RimL family protein N-acetyltransferase
MDVTIVPKSALNARVLDHFRFLSNTHADDIGPCQVWNTESYLANLYAVFNEADIPIGMIYMIGGEDITVDMGWWITPVYRENGYARAAINACAAILKSRGATTVGHIQVRGSFEKQSSGLVDYLKILFDDIQ